MSGIHNANAYLGLAVDALSASSRTLKERLIFAALNIVNDIKADDLPPGDLRAKFERLEKSLTQMPPQLPSDGRIQATIRAMTDFEAEETARAILALASEVEEDASRQSNRAGSR